MMDTDLGGPLSEFRADMPEATPAYLARARATLLSRPPARSRRLRVKAAIAGAVTIGTAGGLLAVDLLSAGPAAAASVVLNKAADALTAQPDPQVHEGQFTFVETVQRVVTGPNPNGKAPIGSAVRLRTWVPVDGKGNGRDVATSEDGVKVFSDSPYVVVHADGIPLASPYYDYVISLPTDPKALLKVLYAQADMMDAKHRDQTAFSLIEGVVDREYVPPSIRAAFYRAAALIPGVTVIDDVADGSGRHGIGVARTDQETDGTRGTVVLIFDRKTYTLLGDHFWTVGGGFESFDTLVRSGVVDTISKMP